MQQFSVRPKTRAMQVIEASLGEPIEVYLRRRYESDRLTTQEIADELGLNNGTVSRWMAHLGIDARVYGPRREAASA